MFKSLWYVLKGLAAAPPAILFIIGAIQRAKSVNALKCAVSSQGLKTATMASTETDQRGVMIIRTAYSEPQGNPGRLETGEGIR